LWVNGWLLLFKQFDSRILPGPRPSPDLLISKVRLEPKDDLEINGRHNTMLQQEIRMMECLASTGPCSTLVPLFATLSQRKFGDSVSLTKLLRAK